NTSTFISPFFFEPTVINLYLFMKKLLHFQWVGALLLLLFSSEMFAQPGVLGSDLGNGNYLTYNLVSKGGFKQHRLVATSGAASGARKWEFAGGTTSNINWATTWRPYSGGQTLSANAFIPTSYNNGAKFNSGGGAGGLLPAITAGRYYTFNVSNN